MKEFFYFDHRKMKKSTVVSCPSALGFRWKRWQWAALNHRYVVADLEIPLIQSRLAYQETLILTQDWLADHEFPRSASRS
jgi:hypothetical protein